MGVSHIGLWLSKRGVLIPGGEGWILGGSQMFK